MTDREKLIDLVGNFLSYLPWGQISSHTPKELADHLIANGVTFAKDTNVPSWIPVTERLPEDDLPKDSKRKSIKVLCAYKTSSGVWVIRTQTREKGMWYRRPKEWDWVKSENITHWMPLPEAPKEVE